MYVHNMGYLYVIYLYANLYKIQFLYEIFINMYINTVYRNRYNIKHIKCLQVLSSSHPFIHYLSVKTQSYSSEPFCYLIWTWLVWEHYSQTRMNRTITKATGKPVAMTNRETVNHHKWVYQALFVIWI